MRYSSSKGRVVRRRVGGGVEAEEEGVVAYRPLIRLVALWRVLQ